MEYTDEGTLRIIKFALADPSIRDEVLLEELDQMLNDKIKDYQMAVDNCPCGKTV
jgi:hypothetical protein